MTDSCQTCRFMRINSDNTPRCHYAEPRITNPNYQIAMWPMVQADDWCGRWQAVLDLPPPNP